MFTLVKSCDCKLCSEDHDERKRKPKESVETFLSEHVSVEFHEAFVKLWSQVTEKDTRFPDRVLSSSILDVLPAVEWDPELTQPAQLPTLLQYLFRSLATDLARQDPSYSYLNVVFKWEAVIQLQNCLVDPSGKLVDEFQAVHLKNCVYVDPLGRAGRDESNLTLPPFFESSVFEGIPQVSIHFP